MSLSESLGRLSQYLTHVEPKNRSGKSVAAAIYEAIRKTLLCEKQIEVDSDETACMTGTS